MTEPALLVQDLQVRYPGRPAPAVDGVTLAAAPGEVTVLLGPNGAGKTSTIECCVGLRTPSAGSIHALGATGAGLQDPEHRARVGVMLQDGGLPTGVKPIALLRHLAGFYADPIEVGAIVERLGIAEFARTTVRRLSGGQRQRLALAAALIGRPALVFLDEPTAGLDPRSRLVVRDLLAEQCADGVAVLLTTHDLDEAGRVAQRVVVMNEGRVVADATPIELTAGLPRTIVVRLPVAAGSGTQAAPDGLLAVLPGMARHAAADYRATGSHIGPAQLADVSRWCAENGYHAADLELRPPSLEDVVLSLTARSA